jgi:phosphoribosyl-ATP pyrophosphohydrolase
MGNLFTKIKNVDKHKLEKKIDEENNKIIDQEEDESTTCIVTELSDIISDKYKLESICIEK